MTRLDLINYIEHTQIFQSGYYSFNPPHQLYTIGFFFVVFLFTK